jgi:hypothetical protein
MLRDYIEKYNLNKDDELFINNFKNYSPPKINLDFKKDRKLNDPILTSFIQELREIPKIKNKEILYKDKFIKEFYRIFWNPIKELAIGTQNFYDFINPIVEELNRITTKDYVIYDCRSTDNYNCGRAMIEINLYPSKFLIFNSQDGLMDINTQIFYSNYKKNINRECPSMEENIDKELIVKIYGKYSNRILKEINLLNKKFKVNTVKDKGLIKLILQDNNNFITFILPVNYPFSSPSGTFNGRTISEMDFDWDTSKNLKLITDKLLKKKLPFSKTLSNGSLKKFCSYLIL